MPHVDPSLDRLSFGAYFRLKDQARRTFKLDPERDSDLYVDLNGSETALRQALNEAAPKVVIEGDIGTGKTHALHHVASLARADRAETDPIIHTLSGFEHKTRFVEGVHRGLFEKLLSLFLRDSRVYDAMLASFELRDRLLDPVKKALYNLRSDVPTTVDAARAWLCASRVLTPSRALKAGYTALLDEIMQPSDLASLYASFGSAWKATTGRRLVILLDESEAFSHVQHVDAQASIGSGLRTLFDSSNQSLGLFLGLNTPRARKGTHPMLRSDVRSRVTTTILLPSLQDRKLRERFVDQLWTKLAADPTSRPFMLDSDARRFVIDEIDLLRHRLLRDQQLASPTARDMLNVLDLLAQSAYQAQAPLPLDEATLRRWTGVPSPRLATG